VAPDEEFGMAQYESVKAIAKASGISPWVLYRSIRAGVVQARRLTPRGHLYVTREAVEAALRPASDPDLTKLQASSRS
jgi:hypothetical protein